MNKVSVISHQNFGEVRSMLINGEPWFVAKDVCDILGISKYRDAILFLDEDEKGCPVVVDTLGGKQEMTSINESGLYSLIFQSRKPEAKAFRKWVTSEVLPSIRKHGYYVNPQAVLSSAQVRRLHRENLKMLDKWITNKDIYDCYLKLRVKEDYIHSVLIGHSVNNEIMNDLQVRAIKNRNNYVNAYSPERMQEVINILAR